MQERKFKLSPENTAFIRDEAGEQARLARSVGVELSLFTRYLKGERWTPESVLTRLARETGKLPGDFLTDVAEKSLVNSIFPLDKVTSAGVS